MQIILHKDNSRNAEVIDQIVAGMFVDLFEEEGGYEAVKQLKSANINQLMHGFDSLLEHTLYPQTARLVTKAVKLRYGCNKLFGISESAKKMLMLDVYKILHS